MRTVPEVEAVAGISLAFAGSPQVMPVRSARPVTDRCHTESISRNFDVGGTVHRSVPGIRSTPVPGTLQGEGTNEVTQKGMGHRRRAHRLRGCGVDGDGQCRTRSAARHRTRQRLRYAWLSTSGSSGRDKQQTCTRRARHVPQSGATPSGLRYVAFERTPKNLKVVGGDFRIVANNQ